VEIYYVCWNLFFSLSYIARKESVYYAKFKNVVGIVIQGIERRNESGIQSKEYNCI
jgi:hypothetical protein